MNTIPYGMRILVMAVLTILAGAAAAQAPPAARGGVPVIGTVHDSLTRQTLPGARVQLVPADGTPGIPRTTVADSIGRFTFDQVERGAYIIGFFHPLLDSLTLEPILRKLEVTGERPVRANLATPSPARLRAAFCASREAGRSTAALVGIVRDARSGAPVAGASVAGEWTDLAVGRGRLRPVRSRVGATTGENGWFALCGVPSPGSLALSAHRGGDSTDRLELRMPDNGFLRRELHVGPARPSPDTAVAARDRRVGDGRLSGWVMTTRGEPLGGAIVGIARGRQTRTSATGEWALTELPLGTRILEVRAIGYYPEHRITEVVADPSAVVVVLSTLESVLDTVRIRAKMLGGGDPSGFEDRRRSSGFGRFLTEAEIRRRNLVLASDLFKSVPGIKVETDIRMRGAFSEPGTMGDCTPALFIDGRALPAPFGLTSEDIDMWVRPAEILGIEIYPDVPPPQFQVPFLGCGSIVIWTKRPGARR